MRIYVEGIGLLGPGLNGWAASRPVLAGGKPYVHVPTVIASSDLLPPAERRRTGVPVKLALAAGHEAFKNAGRDPSTTATVFTSSGGDNDNVHHICEVLATLDRGVSPTRFHNSVHNAAAGYWCIAAQSREPSTSLSCYDESFAAGLLEASSQIMVDSHPVALIAYDHPYPEPMAAVRKIGGNFGTSLVLTPQPTSRTFASLEVRFVAANAASTTMPDSGLEAIRATIPAARSLPLLSALARGTREEVLLEYLPGSHLHITARSLAC